MAAQSQTARQHTVPEVQKLRNAVEFMDCLSQDGFSEIASIARIALSSLETPNGYRNLDNIANALKAILGKADDIQNCINGEAEQVGCNYTDDARRRRWDALRQAREAGVRPEQGYAEHVLRDVPGQDAVLGRSQDEAQGKAAPGIAL